MKDRGAKRNGSEQNPSESANPALDTIEDFRVSSETGNQPFSITYIIEENDTFSTFTWTFFVEKLQDPDEVRINNRRKR